MKKMQNVREGTRKNASRKKELALALCVSLWMAGGSVASARGSLYINADTQQVTAENADPPVVPSPAVGSTATNKTLTVTGGDWSGDSWSIYGGYSRTQSVSGYNLILDGVTGVNQVRGAKSSTGSFDGTATGSSVTLIDSTINNILGGESNNSAMDQVTGNTLYLYGANTVEVYPTGAGGYTGGVVQNFETIHIKSATWGTPVLTLKGVLGLASGIRANDGGSTTTINAADLKLSAPEAVAVGASTKLIECTGNATITAALASNTTTQAYPLSPVAGVTINAALNGSLVLTTTALTYTATENKASKLTFTDVEWKDSGALINHATDATKNIDFNGAAVDTTKLAFTNPGSAGGTMTLIANAGALANPSNTVSQSYALNPVAGLSIDAALNGSVALSDNNLIYSVTSNKANKLTFGDVEWKDTGALLTRPANITFAGADVDTTNINFTNIKSLEANKKMTLVSDFGNSVGTITGTKYKVGSTLEGTGKASLVGSDLIFTAETGTGGKPDVTPQEQTHNTVMGAEVGMAALSAGNDFVGSATEGLSLASNVGADGVSSFAQMGGGSMRQETGSHVDTHTWNAILALGHQNKKERGTFEYGAFFEYGSGNYTTHNGDERGDGSMHYTGGGLLAKYTRANGVYVEGSLRAGSVHDDARNVLRDVQTRVPYSYETNAPYMGFHLGVGKEIALTNGNTVDVYGKYFYNRRNSVSFDVGAGDHYDLDAVTSQVVRVGARYNIKRDKWNFYAGAAYEHELDGKAAGTAGNGGVSAPIRGADVGGASFRGELGATMRPGENSPWNLDLNVSGFAGKKQGFTGGVSVAFMF